MDKERALKLQKRLTREALALLVIHGSTVETDNYERAIILTGAAWGLDPKNAEGQLELITRERAMLQSASGSEAVQHILPESDLPMKASGMETLDKRFCDSGLPMILDIQRPNYRKDFRAE